MSQSEVVIILNRFIARLKEEGIPVEKAILFGSYARQEANENSDIDVLIVSSFFNSGDLSSKLLVWKLVREIDARIEPLTIGSDQFKNDDISPIITIAKKEGILIQC